MHNKYIFIQGIYTGFYCNLPDDFPSHSRVPFNDLVKFHTIQRMDEIACLIRLHIYFNLMKSPSL